MFVPLDGSVAVLSSFSAVRLPLLLLCPSSSDGFLCLSDAELECSFLFSLLDTRGGCFLSLHTGVETVSKNRRV